MSVAAAISQKARELCLVKGVDTVPRGHVRLQTQFFYPDGSSIDLFVQQPANLFGDYVLTDFGQTFTWLADVQVKPWQSKKRQRFVEDALRVLDVRLAGGAIEAVLARDLSNFEDAIVRLGQACVRVADLMFTRRSSFQASSFTDEVEELLVDSGLAYEPDALLAGRHGSVIQVDFLIRGPQHTSAILTLSSQNSTAAHASVNELLRRWYALDVPTWAGQKLTVFDDRFDVYRSDDLAMLKDFSQLWPMSSRREIGQALQN